MTISYPLEAPEPGQPIAVAEGIYWIRFPLPIALDHINLYLLEDEAGWYAVDTGMNLDQSKAIWEQLFSDFFAGKPLLGVISTHMHPDHCGLAGWLCERWRAPLYMTLAEYFGARVYSNLQAGVAWTTERFYRRCGLGDDYIEFLGGRLGMFNKIVSPMPTAYNRLVDGYALQIGGRRWQVVIGHGHSPEHASLYCEEDALLLSGDQLIARISSNVSVMATEPEANPLDQWLASLQDLQALDQREPERDILVMASHDRPFYGISTRVAQLQDHHQHHLEAILDACQQPQRAVDLLPVLFDRKIGFGDMSLAVGECVAHLHKLMVDGLIARTLDDNDCYWYQLGNQG